MTRILKLGELAPRSGEYEIRGERGGHTGKENKWIRAHWRYDYSQARWDWVEGHWSK